MAKSAASQGPPSKGERKIELPATMTVKRLAETLGISGVEVIKQLMQNGVMAGINQSIDYDTAAIIASDMGFEVSEKAETQAEAVACVDDEGSAETPTAGRDGYGTYRPRQDQADHLRV